MHNSFLEKVISKFNQVNPVFIIFSILCINKLSYDAFGGEEQYLALAREFINPDWIPGSFHLTEFAGTKLFFQLLIGPLLQIIDFNVFVFFARLISFLLLSIPLSKIFKHLQLNNVLVFIIIQLFLIGHQAFVGGEWIFKGFEPKTIAYIFVFYAFYYLMKNRFTKSIIFSAIGAYFHILVGGWFFVLTMVYLLFAKSNFKELLKYGFLFILILLPFSVYLYLGIFQGRTTEINGVNLNWIYCYYRLPHHLGIFRDTDFFMNHSFYGVLISAFFLVVGVFIAPYVKNKKIKFLNTINIIILSILLFFVLVALADKLFFNCTCKLLLKYYPFRLGALSKLFIYTEVIVLLNNLLSEKKYFAYSLNFVFSAILIVTLFNGINNVKKTILSRVDIAFDEMTNFIKYNTDHRAVFIITGLNTGSYTYITFTRKAERENYAVNKFVPAGTEKLYFWYKRQQNSYKVRKNINFLFELAKTDKIDYVMSANTLKNDRLSMVYHNSKYYLYKIEH
ncbi:MAG: hypothetical protein GXO79_07940 [Chlorobi bacterium]|nr:hypothetical protein [Chlorobiota bacterium]